MPLFSINVLKKITVILLSRLIEKQNDITKMSNIVESIEQKYGSIPDFLLNDISESVKNARKGPRMKFIAELMEKSPDTALKIMKIIDTDHNNLGDRYE